MSPLSVRTKELEEVNPGPTATRFIRGRDSNPKSLLLPHESPQPKHKCFPPTPPHVSSSQRVGQSCIPQHLNFFI